MLGIGSEQWPYTITNSYSGLIHIYPVASKSAADTAFCIKHFSGDRKNIDLSMYSDQSGESIKARKDSGIRDDKSQLGIPQTNALVERTKQFILNKTIVGLLEAGLPPCYWSFPLLVFV